MGSLCKDSGQESMDLEMEVCGLSLYVQSSRCGLGIASGIVHNKDPWIYTWQCVQLTLGVLSRLKIELEYCTERKNTPEAQPAEILVVSGR